MATKLNLKDFDAVYEENKCHAAAAFHSVCKYCFLAKRCCESQESTWVSKTFREITNMLGFSAVKELVVILKKKKNQSSFPLYLFSQFYLGGK